MKTKEQFASSPGAVGSKGGARMAANSPRISSLTLVTAVLLTIALQDRGVAQTTAQQQLQLHPQVKPLSLAHLYWHFLVFQNHLDTKASDLDAHGKDGSKMRGYLQHRLGLSDAQIVAVRVSSGRLTARVKALDAQAATIRAGGHTSTSYAQLSVLTVQREAAINAEISSLKQTLPPAKISALESFLTAFFSASNPAPPPGLSGGQQGAPAAAVQQ